MRISLIAVPNDFGRRAERMGAGPLHLLDSGPSTQLVAAGHVVTTQTLDLSTASLFHAPRLLQFKYAFELSGLRLPTHLSQLWGHRVGILLFFPPHWSYVWGNWGGPRLNAKCAIEMGNLARDIHPASSGH